MWGGLSSCQSLVTAANTHTTRKKARFDSHFGILVINCRREDFVFGGGFTSFGGLLFFCKLSFRRSFFSFLVFFFPFLWRRSPSPFAEPVSCSSCSASAKFSPSLSKYSLFKSPFASPFALFTSALSSEPMEDIFKCRISIGDKEAAKLHEEILQNATVTLPKARLFKLDFHVAYFLLRNEN